MTTTPTDHSELRARLEALCKAGFIEPAYTLDHDEIAVVIALLDQLEAYREALESIADMTDPDDPESYRCDDREGCLDTVQHVSRQALSPNPSPDRAEK